MYDEIDVSTNWEDNFQNMGIPWNCLFWTTYFENYIVISYDTDY